MPTGQIKIYSNDLLNPITTIDVSGNKSTNNYRLPVIVDNVTSSTVKISFGKISGLIESKIYISSEPSLIENGELENQIHHTTLDSTTTTYTFQNISPDSQLFIRVKSITSNFDICGNTSAITVGGPRAELDSPFRNIHLVAPNIIMMVLDNKSVQSFSTTSDVHDGGDEFLKNYFGDIYESGPWTVTRKNSSPINVTNIYRDSQPVSAPEYEVGGTYDNISKLDVDHIIYLKLDQNIGSNELLDISGPNNTIVKFIFSDKYTVTPSIQVNQVGYSPRATLRYAYVSNWLGTGGPLDLVNFPSIANVYKESSIHRQIVLSNLTINNRSSIMTGGGVDTTTGYDIDAGTTVKEIDIAAIPSSETTVYRIQIPGVGVSWPTCVSETALFKSFYTTTRGLTHNRYGRVLSEDWTEWSGRPADHPIVYDATFKGYRQFFDINTPKITERIVNGGHHDAGDFDIQRIQYEIGLNLLRTFELNKDKLYDEQLTIPESGNGIPDLLSEALYSIRAWEQLQEEDGGVRMGVESWRHPFGIHFADTDPYDYWAYGVDAAHTARCAGLFAQASRLVYPYDSSHAAQLETRAINAYDYAISNGIDASNGGPIIYAASELYRLTDSTTYKNKFEEAWNVQNTFGRGLYDGNYGYYAWETSYNNFDQPHLNDHLFGYMGADVINESYKPIAKLKLTQDAQDAYNSVMNFHAHRNGRPINWSPGWGAGTHVGEYVMRILARMQYDKDVSNDLTETELQNYHNALSLSADYVLGCNPLGKTWLTGLGSRPPMEPLWLDSLSFDKTTDLGPIPGCPVFGPTTSFSPYNHYVYANNTASPSWKDRPLMRRFFDVRLFVINTECDTQRHIKHILLFTSLIKDNAMPPITWKPNGKYHRNYLPPINNDGII